MAAAKQHKLSAHAQDDRTDRRSVYDRDRISTRFSRFGERNTRRIDLQLPRSMVGHEL